MRFDTRRGLVTALAGLMLLGASACGDAGPQKPIAATASAAAIDPKTECHTVIKARQTALDALAPVSVTLARTGLSAEDVAKASDDVEAIFTTMHVDVAGAAERVGDPQLKAKFASYQLSVEQAIVAVEGTDGDKTRLAAAIDLPAPRDSAEAVMAACTMTTGAS